VAADLKVDPRMFMLVIERFGGFGYHSRVRVGSATPIVEIARSALGPHRPDTLRFSLEYAPA
jgi:hypothetical protein